jgi:hypothetical protein
MATAGLFFVGVVSTVGLIRTLKHNRLLSEAAVRQADLQLLVYTPQLRPGDVSVPGQGERNVDVVYAAGRLPAGNIEVWLRIEDALFQGTHAMLSQVDQKVMCVTRALSGGPAMNSPFDKMPKAPLPRDERWIGLIWFDPEDRQHRSEWSYTPNNRYRLLEMEFGKLPERRGWFDRIAFWQRNKA